LAERILITGGAGFLGWSLAARLAGSAEVVLLDRLCHDPDLQRARAAAIGAELIEADVADEATLERAMDGCARVIHLASLAGVERVAADPVGTMRTQLEGTLGLLQACLRTRPERVLLFSSSEVYGPQADGVGENDAPAGLAVGEARWCYGAAKLASEHLGLAHFTQHGLPVCSIRPFNVYGPGQLGLGAVRIFVERALRGEPIALHNAGEQVRAWCHVHDLVQGTLAALMSSEAPGRVYNLGNPSAKATTRELARLVIDLCGSTSPIEQVSRAGPEVFSRVPNIGRARAELGFDPRVDLAAGLAQTIAWVRAGDPLALPTFLADGDPQ
jgi:UDP-glucose 4-epimerase